MCLNKTCRNILGISEFSVGWVSVSIYSQDIKKRIFEVVFFSSLFQGFSPRSFENHRGFGAFRHQQLRVFEPGGCPGAPYCNEIFASGEFSVVFASLLLRELEIWKPTDHGKYKSTPGEDVLPEIAWFHERVSLVKGFFHNKTTSGCS